MEDEIIDYFFCDNCANKDFQLVHNFYLRFHKVNFADNLIYDELKQVRYQCTNCKRTFSKEEIEQSLQEIKKRRRGVSC